MRPRAAGLGTAVAAIALLFGTGPFAGPGPDAGPAQAAAQTTAKQPAAKPAPAKAPASSKKSTSKSAAKGAAATGTPATVATVGDRIIDERDIQFAASALADDPARKRNPEAWRRGLLDRCVDRELLAMEAERRGLAGDPAVKARLDEREYAILLREMEQRILVPNLKPKPEDLPQVRLTGGYRLIDLYYIFIPQEAEGPDNAALARRLTERAKGGAPFDSLARLFSAHPPSKEAGGRVGWIPVHDLNPAARKDLMNASPGDVVGPYTLRMGYEIMKVGGVQEFTDDSLTAVATVDRKRGLARNHQEAVLEKYRFALDPAQVRPLLFAVGSETPDSILASLGPDGTRPDRGARPAIGVLARCDGDSVLFRDVLRVTPPVIGDTGRMRIRDEATLRDLCARVLAPRLIVRDAKERGLDRDPAVARELRLSRAEILTRAMIARERPSVPDSSVLRAYFEKVRHRYLRPKTTIAEVAVFVTADSAAAVLGRIRQGARADSLLTAAEFIEQPRATPVTLYPGHFARLALPETGTDSLTRAVSGLPAGEFAPIVRTLQGHALARVLAVEDERPGTFEESYARVLGDWAEERADEWVRGQLTRLRAKTPVRVVPGRLEAVKLASASPSMGGGTK